MTLILNLFHLQNLNPKMSPRFMFFPALFIVSNVMIIITGALPVHAIRHPKPTSPVLSLSLHPHDFTINLKTHNHTLRTKFRKEGDAARVNYLNSRLRNALFASKPGFEAEKIQSPVTGLNGGYVARIGVGQPATESSLIVDTGSEIVWLKCSPCKNCSNPIFDPSKSSTYQNLSCTAPQCSENTIGLSCAPTSDADGDGTCSFEAAYGDGSATTGDFVTETLSFGSSGSAKNIAIGCGHEVGGNLQSFGGLLGLGPDPISLPNQLKATSFSYCLVGSSSASTSGTLDFNSAAPGDSITVTMVHNPIIDVFYYVELAGITVGKDQIPVPPEVYQISGDGTGGVIVDSGSTLTYLDSQVYSSFLEAFKKNAQNLASSPTQEGSDACYSFPSGSSLQGPTMSFQFSNGQSLALAPENYFIEGDNSAYCLAFQPTNQIVSIIGNIAQKGMRVTYDLGNNQIGFSLNKC